MKKVLVIANPYPPQASAGTTRVVRFLRHLPAQGWEPTVAGGARRRARPPCRPDVRVLRAAAPVPAVLRGGGRRSQPRQQLAVRAGQLRAVGRAGGARRAATARSTSGSTPSSPARRGPARTWSRPLLEPPSGVPWLADYRDPWSHLPVPHLPHALRTAAAHAASKPCALGRAAAVTAVNQPILDDLRGAASRGWHDRAHVLANGFDRDRGRRPGEPRRGLLAGAHGPAVRPRAAGGGLPAGRVAALPADVKLLFVGMDERKVRPDGAARSALAQRVRVEPLVPPGARPRLQRAADALLLVNGRRPESMSSKVFEYLRAGRPIFAVSPAGSAARALFEQTGGGTCVLPDEPMASRSPRSSPPVRRAAAPAADTAALERYDVAASPAAWPAARRPRPVPVGRSVPIERPPQGSYRAERRGGAAPRRSPSTKAAPRMRRTGGRRRGPELVLLAAAVIVLLASSRLPPPSAPRRRGAAGVHRARRARPERRWLGAAAPARIIMAGVLLLPAAALLGPVLALPSLPQLFAFRAAARPRGLRRRHLAAAVAPQPHVRRRGHRRVAGVCGSAGWWWASCGPATRPPACATSSSLLTMMLLVAAPPRPAPAAGACRSWARCSSLAFVAISASPCWSTPLGFRLPASRPANTRDRSQSFAVTSVFHNQNDLATYLAICWPFMLCAFFFTQRIGWLGLATLSLLFSAARVPAHRLALEPGGRGHRVPRAPWSCSAASPGAWPRAAARSWASWWPSCWSRPAATCCSTTRSPRVLRQFRLQTLIGEAKANQGSGAIRADLTHRGFDIAGGSYLLGAGPGPGRSHHRLRRQRPGHQQPAQLVA